MVWTDLERAFNRAALLSFSKRKIALTFPVLVLCGILIVFCFTAAYEASRWMAISLLFLPLLFSSSLLLALGVLLAKIHYHEVKQLKLDLREFFSTSADFMVGTLYLSMLPILVYLCLWILMGIFLLLQAIPGIGDFFSVVFSFGPFLLIFGSILLCSFNLSLLFFLAPAASSQKLKAVSLGKWVLGIFRKRLLSSIFFFLIALIPLALIISLLVVSGMLTHASFLKVDHSLSAALIGFFIMLPCAAIATPFVVFFFNFSVESHQLLQDPL